MGRSRFEMKIASVKQLQDPLVNNCSEKARMTSEEALSILDTFLQQGRLSDLQEQVFRQSWEGRTYQEIAENSGYDADYIRDVGCKLWQLLSKAMGEQVTKNNLRSVLRRGSQQAQGTTTLLAAPPVTTDANQNQADLLKIPNGNYTDSRGIAVNQRQDWGEAMDISMFLGRTTELTTLTEWIVQDRCRLVMLLGMGGTGKTALAVKLAEQIQGKFDYLIWRSLRNAPQIEDILADLIQFLSSQPGTGSKGDSESRPLLPGTVDGRISRLIDCLRTSRCLIVLDNAESILRSGEGTLQERAGYYRAGYERYGQLLRQISEGRHQSCLMLTSREKPAGLSFREGQALPVRSLQLMGLQEEEGQEILKAAGLSGAEDNWRVLIERYAGNPLALKIVATTIQDLFEGDVLEFLEQGPVVFGDIRHLLNQQLNRLSDLEKQVMHWLSFNRGWISMPELREKIVPPVSQLELLEALESLHRRSLIKRNLTCFTQQSVVMEYMTEQMIRNACEEIAL